MNRTYFRQRLLTTGVALGIGLICAPVNAAVFHLCADSTVKLMPDGASVVMWGYAEDDNADLSDGCGGSPVQSPGPLLSVNPADTEVTVHLRNNLGVDTSLMIPGQASAMTPVFTTDAQGRSRVTSLTHVTSPGAVGTYQWSDFKPGSYSYNSGTHMAVQVQMGLYGGVRKDLSDNVAYVGVPYDEQVVIFYSEVDPALHAAIADGTYGTPPAPTSTIDYQPRYFLVNGAPYEVGSAPLAAAGVGQRTLLRFFNMGLRTVAPTVLDHHLSVVAEDGRPYPYAQEQYSLMMAAGKSSDAILTATQEGSVAIYDRMLNLSSGAAAPSGLYAFLQVGPAATGQPVALADEYVVAEDTPLSIPAPGVLANDSDPDGDPLTAQLVSGASIGNVVLGPDGSFEYSAPLDFNGVATFSYAASDGALSSAPATVTITVTPVNDAPLAFDDQYSGTQDTVLVVGAPGVLANDSDVDGDTLTASIASDPSSGIVSFNADGSFSYTPSAGFSGSDSFTYAASDGIESSVATVVLTIAEAVNQAPVAVDDFAEMQMNTVLVLDLLANDSDPDGTLDPASMEIDANLKKGNILVNNLDGTVTFTPRKNFRGSESFTYTVKDDQGAVSNSALVRINVVR